MADVLRPAGGRSVRPGAIIEGPVPETTDRLSQRFAAARDAAATALRAGEGGMALSAAMSRAMEEAVVSAVGPAMGTAPPQAGPVGLIAYGGLARGELGPNSDLDLLVLCPGGTADPGLDAWMQTLLDPLWSSGLTVNATVHDPAGWLRAAQDDLTLCTALLDARCIAGDPEPLAAVMDQAWATLFGDARGPFLDWLLDEMDARHPRLDDTVYRVEPDLKHGPGGLRDLAAMGWCLRATHRCDDLDQLAARFLVPPAIAASLQSARDDLLRLRAALHFAARRNQDRLVFQYQEQLPEVLGESPGDDAALVRSIEEAMQTYYRAARTVRRYGRRLSDRCRPPAAEPGRAVRVDERFRIRAGRLEHDGMESFDETPMLTFSALQLARDRQVPLAGRTFDRMAECVASGRADKLAHDPEAQLRFLEVLANPEDGDTLDLCNELGLLEIMVPSFGAIRGRMQHDGYHVYTVDQHTLRALEMLKAIARGEHRKDFPLATALHLEIDDPRVLYLALLVHDAGKAGEGDQCDEGALLAREAALAFGFAEDEANRCALLVREHLTMPLMSQKRDLSDPLLVEQLADVVEDRPTLRELYLLSLADMANVRPGNVTGWKLTLLDELYLLTSAQLQRGIVGFARLERPDEPRGLPERYYALYDAELRREHAQILEQVDDEVRPVVLHLAAGSGALRLTVAGRNRAGLLAHVTTMLNDHGLEVAAADIFLVPGPPALALDVFRIQPTAAAEGAGAQLDAEALSQIESALAVSPPIDPAATPPPLPVPRRTQALPAGTTVGFDEDPAGERTIVEIETPDQPGVLRRITGAFAAVGVEILLARCSAEAQFVHDVFYVSRMDPATREELEKRLHSYLRRG